MMEEREKVKLKKHIERHMMSLEETDKPEIIRQLATATLVGAIMAAHLDSAEIVRWITDENYAAATQWANKTNEILRDIKCP